MNSFEALHDKTIAIVKIKKWVRQTHTSSNHELNTLSKLHPLEVREIFRRKNPDFYNAHLKSQVESAIVDLGLDESVKIKFDKYAVSKQWLKVFLLMIVCSYVYTSWDYVHMLPKSATVTFTFSFISIILSYFLIFLFLKKIKIKRDTLALLGLVFMLSLGLKGIVQTFSNTKVSFPGHPRFVGIFTNVSSETDYAGRYDGNEVHVTPFVKHELFNVDNENWLNAVHDLEKKNEIVDVQPFIFWQTGMSESYFPSNIAAYTKPTDFYDKLELYLTVGPIVVIEALIVSIYRYLLYVAVIYFAFHFYARRKGSYEEIPLKIPIILNDY